MQWRLFWLQALVLGLLTLLLGGVLTVRLRHATTEGFGQRALLDSRMVAALPEVAQALERGQLDPQINSLANTVRRNLGADFIVIADRRGIRWSHPRADHVGKPLTGATNNEPPGEDAAPMHGREQISISQGSLGTSVRAKVPIFGAGGQVLGLVSTGFLLPTVLSSASSVTGALWPWFAASLGVALLCSMWVSRRLRGELLGLEPPQIAALVQQHRAVLDALQEGVLVISAAGGISAANPLATRLLGLSPARGGPLEVAEVWPALASSGLLGGPPSSDAMLLGGLLPGALPVLVSSLPCGAGRVITFRDRAEFTRVAEELTHSRELTDLLRAQSHEFMNRLHTIAGLIHLGRQDEALNLIGEQSRQASSVQELLSGIEVPAVAALILGKFARAHEKRVQLIVEPGSSLGAAWGPHASDVLVPVLGNLLENAFEAAQQHHPAGAGQVRLSIGADPQGLEIEVRDNGAGVPPEILQHALGTQGPGRLSSHGPDRGYGLPLVKRSAQALGGEVHHQRRGEETIFRVSLPALPDRRT